MVIINGYLKRKNDDDCFREIVRWCSKLCCM